ncbi:MAG TPA: hypothetical protein VFY17_09840, partial [Pilimelia sp.]|nr:hypothetical protein [Pilimelia sp.]
PARRDAAAPAARGPAPAAGPGARPPAGTGAGAGAGAAKPTGPAALPPAAAAAPAPPPGFQATLTGTPGSGPPPGVSLPPSAPAAPAPGDASTGQPAFAEVLAGLRGGLREEAPRRPAAAPPAPPAGIAAAPPAPPAGIAAADTAEEDPELAMYGPTAVRRRGDAAAPRGAATGTGRDGAPPGAAAPADADRAAGAPAGGPRSAELERLGVPAPLAAAATAADPYHAVLQALATLPPAPPLPTQPDDLLVLLGELGAALAVADQVIEQLRVGRNALYVVADSLAGTGLHGSRRIVGVADAARKGATLHTTDHPHVVVVDVPLTGRPDGFVQDVCAALDASDVWAVVDATRKTADTAQHLAGMGEVDALAVYGAAATGDPASTLHLDLPVALLDGAPATTHAWAALLAARLGASPVPSRRRRRRGSRHETPVRGDQSPGHGPPPEHHGRRTRPSPTRRSRQEDQS